MWRVLVEVLYSCEQQPQSDSNVTIGYQKIGFIGMSGGAQMSTSPRIHTDAPIVAGGIGRPLEGGFGP